MCVQYTVSTGLDRLSCDLAKCIRVAHIYIYYRTFITVIGNRI